MIRVNEIFYTIQGEAKFTGTPSVFVRLQGCKVGCLWCDTKHTWKADEADKIDGLELIAKTADSPSWAMMTENQIADYVMEAGGELCHVVITGGEPLEQDIGKLAWLLGAKGHSVQVETSGTRPISDEVLRSCWVTVSPKINMAGGLPVLGQALNVADEIKHPVGKRADIDNLKSLLSEKVMANGKKIWLQPLSESKKATKICVDECLVNGWKLSIQTHKQTGIR